MKKGFTFIETFFAVTIMLAALVGVFALIQQTTSFIPVAGQKLVASYLVQEGIEIVRNIRETNKINALDWDTGLTNCNLGCEADYNDLALTSYQNRFLYLADSGFYQYGATATPTIYKRKITITPQESNSLQVKVEVFWQEKGRNHLFSTLENLYDWQ